MKLLNMQTPNQNHSISDREYKEQKSSFDYPIDYKVYKITKNGSIRWGTYHWVYISRAATRRNVGVEEIGNGIWNLYYRNVILACFDEKLLSNKEQYLKLSRIKV